MLPEAPAAPECLDSDPVRLLAGLVSIDSVNPDLVPGGSGERVIADFCGEWPAARHRLTRGLHRDPFEADSEASIVRTLTRHAEQSLGHPPVVRAEPLWTDCALLDRAGVPCLAFGVDGEGAHVATEYVDLASLERLTDILTATITDFCS